MYFINLYVMTSILKPAHDILLPIAQLTSEDSDKPASLHSLARALCEC